MVHRVSHGGAPICSGLASRLGFGWFVMTARAALWVAPPKLAEMPIVLAIVTALVDITKLALATPAGTVTLARAAATAGSALVCATTAPVPEAAPFSSTVPSALAHPPTHLG